MRSGSTIDNTVETLSDSNNREKKHSLMKSVTFIICKMAKVLQCLPLDVILAYLLTQKQNITISHI